MITGSLQIKKGMYYAVLNYKEEEKWKNKWVSTKIKAIKGKKREAEVKLKQIIEEFENKQDITTVNNTETILFIEFMYKWLEIIKHSIEDTTYMGYHKLIYGRMTDYFKVHKITLQDLKAQDIQDFYQYLLGFNLSGNTVTRYHANIRKALQYAVKTDLILSNCADKVEKPKITHYNVSFYTNEQIQKLLDIMENTSIRIPVLLASYYGLRRSEVIGLKWSAIDFNNKTITIEHVVVNISSNGKQRLVGKDRTKTNSSHRTLPLLEQVEQELLLLKAKQEENKKIYKNCYNNRYLDYICVNEMGTLLNPDYVSHKFRKILKANNMKIIRFHDLRHSCASLLLANGVHLKQIQVWLGHSNYNTTANIYAHLDTNAMNDTGNVISNVLNTKKISVCA